MTWNLERKKKYYEEFVQQRIMRGNIYYLYRKSYVNSKRFAFETILVS